MMHRPKLRWGFLITWIFFNILGLAMGVGLRQLLFGGPLGGGAGLGGRVIVGAIIGTGIGLAQILALPQRLSGKRVWLIATIAGWAIGWSGGWRLGWAILGPLGFRAIFISMAGLAGLIASFGQWHLLPRSAAWRSGWLVVQPGGWMLGWAVGSNVPGNLAWFVAGGLSGLFTGLFLLWLLRDQFSTRHNF